MKFPDGASVYAWFAPTHWERFAGPIDGRVAVRPCPTLQDVATLYHDADLPRAIVRNAISGLASPSDCSASSIGPGHGCCSPPSPSSSSPSCSSPSASP